MRRTHRLSLLSLAASVPLLGLSLAAGPIVLASAASASTASPAGPGFRPLTSLSASNWAGYTDVSTGGSTYNSVGASWTQPAISCTSSSAFAVFWVGIDGMGSSTTEAAGTLAQCNAGVPTYYTWWDMYPASITVVGSTVQPGDSISASVVKSGTTFTLKVTDATHPSVITPATSNSFTIGRACADCPGLSVEWILGQPVPFDIDPSYLLGNFRNWAVNSATAKLGSVTGVISSFPHDSITMVNSAGAPMAQPGSLTSAGNGFTTTWLTGS